MILANYVAAALFALSAVLQYNDPDPAAWIAIYAAAAVACLVFRRHRLAPLVALAVLACALGWIGYLAPDLIAEARPGDLVKSMDDKGGSAELAREAGGLAIVAAWMAVLIWGQARGG